MMTVCVSLVDLDQSIVTTATFITNHAKFDRVTFWDGHASRQ